MSCFKKCVSLFPPRFSSYSFTSSESSGLTLANMCKKLLIIGNKFLPATTEKPMFLKVLTSIKSFSSLTKLAKMAPFGSGALIIRISFVLLAMSILIELGNV